MGIKFKGSDTAGKIPGVSDIDERELALNTKDGKAFTKDPAGNIVELCKCEVGLAAWDATIDYKAGTMVVAPNGPIYTSLGDNTNEEPLTNPLSWQQVGALPNPPIFDDTVDYSYGDIVLFQDPNSAPGVMAEYTALDDIDTAAIATAIADAIANGNTPDDSTPSGSGFWANLGIFTSRVILGGGLWDKQPDSPSGE